MTFKHKLLLKIYGSSFLEAYFADSYLESFADGIPRTDLPIATGTTAFTESRVQNLLISDAYLEVFGNGFVITSRGKMHLDKGGYIESLVSNSFSKTALYLSVFSSLVAIAAFFIALFK